MFLESVVGRQAQGATMVWSWLCCPHRAQMEAGDLGHRGFTPHLATLLPRHPEQVAEALGLPPLAPSSAVTKAMR